MTQAVTLASSLYRAPQVNSPAVVQIGMSPFFETVFRDDLAGTFFSLSEFAESIMIRHTVTNAWLSYSALFDDPSVQVRSAGETETVDVKPSFMVSEIALKYPLEKSDRVMIRGKQYVIDEVESDGVGVLTVRVAKR